MSALPATYFSATEQELQPLTEQALGGDVRNGSVLCQFSSLTFNFIATGRSVRVGFFMSVLVGLHYFIHRGKTHEYV